MDVALFKWVGENFGLVALAFFALVTGFIGFLTWLVRRFRFQRQQEAMAEVFRSDNMTWVEVRSAILLMAVKAGGISTDTFEAATKQSNRWEMLGFRPVGVAQTFRRTVVIVATTPKGD